MAYAWQFTDSIGRPILFRVSFISYEGEWYKDDTRGNDMRMIWGDSNVRGNSGLGWIKVQISSGKNDLSVYFPKCKRLAALLDPSSRSVAFFLCIFPHQPNPSLAFVLFLVCPSLVLTFFASLVIIRNTAFTPWTALLINCSPGYYPASTFYLSFEPRARKEGFL